MSIELVGLAVAIVGTIAGIVQAWLAWQQSRETPPIIASSKSTTTKLSRSNTGIRQTVAIPWGWLLGNLLMNVLVGFLLNAYLISISLRIAVLLAVVAVAWIWSRHWTEFGTEAETAAIVTWGFGILVVVIIFNSYKIPLLSALLGAFLTYGAITAIPDKAKYELFQSLSKLYGFLCLILIALLGLGAGWLIHQTFIQSS